MKYPYVCTGLMYTYIVIVCSHLLIDRATPLPCSWAQIEQPVAREILQETNSAGQ